MQSLNKSKSQLIGELSGLRRKNAELKATEIELRRTEEALRYRNEFELVITTISTTFINLQPDNIDEGINNALKIIGEFAGVDRSYVFQFHENGTMMSNTHEWCSRGITAQKENLQGIASSSTPWWITKLYGFETIHIPSVDDLPMEAGAEKEILRAQNIQSLVVLPMILHGSLVGFLGFDSVRKKKIWSMDVITLLKIVGEIFVNALEYKRTGKVLQKAHDELETKVKERTAELVKTNEVLKKEISERIQAEEALKKSEEKYRNLVEQLNETIFSIDMDGRVTYVNPVVKQLYGYKPSDIIGRAFKDFLVNADEAGVSEDFQRLLSGLSITNEYQILTKNGDTRWIHISAIPIFENNCIVSIQGIVCDITRNKLL